MLFFLYLVLLFLYQFLNRPEKERVRIFSFGIKFAAEIESKKHLTVNQFLWEKENYFQKANYIRREVLPFWFKNFRMFVSCKSHASQATECAIGLSFEFII